MGDDKIMSFRDLESWQKSMELAERIHGAAAAFPQEGEEIASRMRDAAITIPATISEAFALESTGHLIEVVAPLAEMETCVELAKRLEFLAEDLADDLAARVEAIALSLGKVLDEVDQDLEDDDDYPGKPRMDRGHQGHGHSDDCRDQGPHDHRGRGGHGRGHRHNRDCGCEPRRQHHHHSHDDCCGPPRQRRRHYHDDCC